MFAPFVVSLRRTAWKQHAVEWPGAAGVVEGEPVTAKIVFVGIGYGIAMRGEFLGSDRVKSVAQVGEEVAQHCEGLGVGPGISAGLELADVDIEGIARQVGNQQIGRAHV